SSFDCDFFVKRRGSVASERGGVEVGGRRRAGGKRKRPPAGPAPGGALLALAQGTFLPMRRKKRKKRGEEESFTCLHNLGCLFPRVVVERLDPLAFVETDRRGERFRSTRCAAPNDPLAPIDGSFASSLSLVPGSARVGIGVRARGR